MPAMPVVMHDVEIKPPPASAMTSSVSAVSVVRPPVGLPTSVLSTPSSDVNQVQVIHVLALLCQSLLVPTALSACLSRNGVCSKRA